MRALLFFLSFVFALPAYSQARKERFSPDWEARRKRLNDSLEQIFYREPPYVVVSYYQDAHLIPWVAAMTLYVEADHQKVVLQPGSDNKFLLPPLNTDSLVLGFEYRGKKVAFSKEPAWHFAHGATVAFGFINRAHIKPDSSNEYAPYREILRQINLVQWRRAKQVRGILYQITIPRVYGDGTVQTQYKALLRR